MQFKTILLFVFFLGILPISKVQAQDDPVAYMQGIMQPIESLKKETWQYMKSISRGKSMRTIEKRRSELIAANRDARGKIRGKGSYQGNLDFKKSAVDYLLLSETVLKGDFDKILDLEEIAEQSYDAMEAYLTAKEKAYDKLDLAWEDLSNAVDEFAAANNITLVEAEEDKLDKKIGKTSDLFAYYNDLYLIFFKSYKQEAYLMEAINKGDVNSMEQNISALSSTAAEGLADLEGVENFKEDASLKEATHAMLQSYQQLAAEDFPGIVDFYLKRDNFEQLQKAMSAKKKSDRTKEDIDNYNKAVEDMNAASKTINKQNEAMDKRRQKALNAYNKAVNAFFETHSR